MPIPQLTKVVFGETLQSVGGSIVPRSRMGSSQGSYPGDNQGIDVS